MSEVRITRQAASDLDEICFSLYAHNGSLDADSLMASVLEKCRIHAQSPEARFSREELFPGLRYFSLSSYNIFYRTAADGIDVIRVLQSGR